MPWGDGGRAGPGRAPRAVWGPVRIAVSAAWMALGAAAAAGAQPAPAAAARAGAADLLPAGVETSTHRGFPAVELAALAGPVFSGVSVRGTEGRARIGPEVLVLRAGSPFVRHGGSVFQLANAPYLAGGRLWVPVELLGERHPIAGRLRAAPEAAAQRPPPAAPPVLAERARRPGPWRVVIDPGHGGHDPGTVSRRSGTREKDVTLAIARRLRARLERRPEVESILTRSDDRFVRLADRSRLATTKEADLFVSIHVNAEERGSGAAGFETYFLSEARSEESRRVAMRENSVLELEGGADPQTLSALQYILASLEQSGNVQESMRFAGFVQNELRREIPGDDRGVKQAGFYVLMGATGSMPAVLVEAGFLTNPSDERRLRSAGGQEEVAASLERAIASYFAEVDRRLARLSAAGAGE